MLKVEFFELTFRAHCFKNISYTPFPLTNGEIRVCCVRYGTPVRSGSFFLPDNQKLILKTQKCAEFQGLQKC